MACRSTMGSRNGQLRLPNLNRLGLAPLSCVARLLSASPAAAQSHLIGNTPLFGQVLGLHPAVAARQNDLTAAAAFYIDPTLWEQAKWAVFTGFGLLVVLGALVFYLLYKQRQLQHARSEQMRLSGMLINAQEEERKRLASELHDDFSQRLALLSLALEMAAESAPESMQAQLHELLNSASELGADLHTLSHRLHSATLERLGLVPGVTAFCREFTNQQGIQVGFSHQNVPRSVPPATALCLFRAVQEGLRNVKKHSGASRAEVKLNGVDGHLHLAIADDGVGFDAGQLARKQGLGILSMEERARLIGARFTIDSAPRKGTRIEVWAPVPTNGAGSTHEHEARHVAALEIGVQA